MTVFVLGNHIGSGVYGSVYCATWHNQPCAAKAFFLKEDDFLDEDIQREIAILRRLRHRHIIQFYRTYELDGTIYLIMDHAETGSLSDIILKNEPLLDWPSKTRIAHEIARGLEYIHLQNILHRDLKSANVLLTRHLEVKLCDFGLAKVKTATSSFSAGSPSSRGGGEGGLGGGTIRWMAPELFQLSPPYSTKSDIYALGMVMWEIAATCTTPFGDHDCNEMVALLVEVGEREDLPDDTPTEYSSWVERCWKQDPKERPEAKDVVFVNVAVTEVLGNHNTEISFLEFPSNDDEEEEQCGDSLGSEEQREVHLLGERAKNNDIEAQMMLAKRYELGDGVHKSRECAFYWYHRAALQGHVQAQFLTAEMYAHGQGVIQNNFEAVWWYRRAIENGHTEALSSLGRLRSSFHEDRADEEIIPYRDLPIPQQKNAGNFFSIGKQFEFGAGVKQSAVEAAYWYLRAANLGNLRAQTALTKMYKDGRGVQQDDVIALSWFTKAAEKGDAAAQNELGWRYQYGRGVTQNDEEARKWYRSAAELGNVTAQIALGAMYQYGQGTQQSDAMAASWYRKAAEQKDASAQSQLGWMYEYGRGVAQSYVEAAQWYRSAAEQGNAAAQTSLGELYRSGRGIDQNHEMAARLFLKAAEQDHVPAQFILSQCYEQGLGVPKDHHLAAQWRAKATGLSQPITRHRVRQVEE